LLPSVSERISGPCLQDAYRGARALRQKLTPAFVKNVAPAATSQIYWDTELRGFGLLVLPSGEKRYVVQYRANRRSRRMTFKSGLTLMQARKEAKKAIGTVAKGGDPLAERRKKEAEASNTLKAIAEEYFKREGHKLRSADQRKKTFVGAVHDRRAPISMRRTRQRAERPAASRMGGLPWRPAVPISFTGDSARHLNEGDAWIRTNTSSI
jgi:hypothetical protein